MIGYLNCHVALTSALPEQMRCVSGKPSKAARGQDVTRIDMEFRLVRVAGHPFIPRWEAFVMHMVFFCGTYEVRL